MSQVLSDQPEIERLDGREYPKVSPKRTHGLVQGSAYAMLLRLAKERGQVVREWRFHLRPGTSL